MRKSPDPIDHYQIRG